jgi:hypothetical protein
MQPRFFYHTETDEAQHTFIAAPIQTSSLAFSGWGPKL